MRKIFTLLTMCMLASAAWALDITFDATVDFGNGTTSASAYQVEKSGVSFSVSNGLINGHYRIYKGQTATFNSTIGEIVKIVFECTASGEAQYGPGCFTANPGNYTFAENIGTWTGSATNIVFTAASNQVRATKIIVTVNEAGLLPPTITPAGGTYYDPIQVSITCPSSGSKIYYTTNGSNPTTSSTQYTAPFTLSANTTVKAISAKDGETSDVVTATYVFSSERLGLASLFTMDDNTDVVMGYDATVLIQKGTTMYVKDQTGYGLIFGTTNQTYTAGDIIPSGYGGQKVTYNAEPELKNPVGFEPASGRVTLTAEEITAAQVNHNTWAHYVLFKDAVISMTDENNGTLTDANGGTCPIFNKTFGATLPTDGKPHNVYAIVAAYQKGGQGDVVYQILPVKVEGDTPPPGEGYGLGDLASVENNTTVTMKYDATVLIQKSTTMYVKDQTGYGLLYGATGQTYKRGDVIPSGYGGLKVTYNAEPELKELTGFQASTSSVQVNPEIIKANQVNHSYWAHLVCFENALITMTDNDNGTLTDADGNTCPIYNRTFGITLPTDGQRHNVIAIVASYQKGGQGDVVYQILPVEVVMEELPPVDVECIEDVFALSAGAKGHFTTPLTVIYQNGLNLYVQDAEGVQTLAYGSESVQSDLINGDLINDAVVSWSLYQNVPQMIPYENFVKAGYGEPVMPLEYPCEDISQDIVNWYVCVADATIRKDDSGKNTLIDDGTDALILYDKFKIGLPEDSNTHTVWGFVGIYNGSLEIFPISIDVDPTPQPGHDLKGDVDGDGEVGLGDINTLIDILLGGQFDAATMKRADVDADGEISISDINSVIDIILSA